MSAAMSGGFASMREAYEQSEGAASYYAEHGAKYRNPHEPALTAALAAALGRLETAGQLDCSTRQLRMLDLACGSGEATLAVRQWVASRAGRQQPACTAADPFTHQAFEERVGEPCRRWSFEDVSAGELDEEEPFDLAIAVTGA